ncbi:MAG: class I SAM-dependent methyltransferase [Caldilinea sp. CFX5]|nr:class I SAM-dependent methyltransferase [Caldilinea sp. CFX5]
MNSIYAEQFKDHSVVDAYAHRPPIPDPVFTVLDQLLVDKPRVVLDVGCGTGAIARRLASSVERVDAVDFSAAMLARGRQLPGGDRDNIRWIHGKMEDVPLSPPYGLVVAAGSLHWMEWEIVMPRFRSILTPQGLLAIVWQSEVTQPWSYEIGQLVHRYSTNQGYQSVNLVEELVTRQIFQQLGEQHTLPVSFTQSIANYIESIHSRNGCSRQRMTLEAATLFDKALTSLLEDAYPDGEVSLGIVGHVVWGKPAPV